MRNTRRNWLIPAHAGKTPADSTQRIVPTAHPRSRGENGEDLLREARARGSSPLTRGKPTCTWSGTTRLGLIPAHAGKTRPPARPAAGRSAHPRSRGENTLHALDVALLVGSSPLTRGKHGEGLVHLDPYGLIPAHAGKTHWRSTGPPRLPAHPRSRGENSPLAGGRPEPSGSSPLTRGKLTRGTASCVTRGLIPAHAGKTAGAGESAR